MEELDRGFTFKIASIITLTARHVIVENIIWNKKTKKTQSY